MHAPERTRWPAGFNPHNHLANDSGHHPHRQARANRHHGAPAAHEQGQHNRCQDGQDGFNLQRLDQGYQLVLLPAGHRSKRQDQQQRQHNGYKDSIEVRGADRQFAEIQGIDHHGVHRAQQYRPRARQQQYVIDEQEGLARHQCKGPTPTHRRRTPGKQRQRPTHHNGQKDQNENTTGGVRREGVNGGQHARTHNKGTEQRERKGPNGQQHRPVFETAALFGNRQRVNQRRANQPGHKGGILDRVPEPPTTPPQFVISPVRTQRNTDGEKHPGGQRPRTRPAGPGNIESARQ